MIARLILAPALIFALAAPAHADQRRVYIGSFDSVRVQGPFDVRIVDGPPGATLTGERGVIEAVEVRVDGTTLTIENGIDQWGERAQANAAHPVTITVSTRSVANAVVIGGAKLSIARMKAPRVALSVAGTGAIDARGIAADQASAMVIGGGAIALAGTTQAAQLSTNGPGAIDAGGLVADEVTVRVDGPGSVKAQARYEATVDNLGLGQVEVAGRPKCTVRAPVGGAVVCGE